MLPVTRLTLLNIDKISFIMVSHIVIHNYVAGFSSKINALEFARDFRLKMA